MTIPNWMRSVSTLPTRTNANPTDIDSWTYGADDGVIGYVLGFNKSRRLFTSYGTLPGFVLGGDLHEFHHDQTCRTLGFWKVVGIVRVTKSEIAGLKTTTLIFEGEVPNRKLSHWVCK